MDRARAFVDMSRVDVIAGSSPSDQVASETLFATKSPPAALTSSATIDLLSFGDPRIQFS